MSAWRRALACLGIAAAGLALSGCHVQGTVDMVSTDDVSIDLLVSGAGVSCDADTEGSAIRAEPTTTPAGAAACRITGTMKLSDVGFTQASVVDAAEYRVVAITLPDGRSAWPDGEVALRFPGDVVRASEGVIVGNELRLDPSALPTANLEIVALNRPGPQSWVIGTAAGVAAGVLASLAVLGAFVLLRRRGRMPAARVPVALAGPVDGAGEATRVAGGEEHDAVPDTPLTSVPDDEVAAPEPVDHSWLAAPPQDSPRPQQAPAPVAPEDVASPEKPDHTMWAPPDA